MRGAGSVFKFLRCDCGMQRRVKEIFKKAPPCPKCTKAATYSEFWYIAYRKPDGTEAREPISTVKKEAEDELKRVLAKIVDDKYSDKKSEISWDASVKEFLAYKKATVKHDTYRFYRDHLRIIAPYFNKFKISEILPQHVTAYILAREGKVTNTTINHDVVALKTMLSTFAKGFVRDPKGNKYIETNPLAFFGKLQGNDERTTTYTDEEVKSLLEKAQHLAIKPFVVLGVDAGLRKRTVITLEKSFINWDLNRLEIPASRRKRGRYIHYVIMTKRLQENLKLWLNSMTEAEQKSKYVFPAPTDPEKYFYSIEKPWQKTLKVCGITDKTFHDTKHTAGTKFYEANEDIYATAEFLDHADINMSKKYAHQVDAKRQRAMDKFEALQKAGDASCDAKENSDPVG